MKDKKDLNLPNDLRYTDEHVWVRKDGDELIAGISDYAQDQLGEVAFVDLPAEGKHLNAHDEFGSIESVKAVNALYMPVAGEVIAINEALDGAPEEVNASCYNNGWLIKIKPDNPADVNALFDAGAYLAQLK